jgi:hypothetical protein
MLQTYVSSVSGVPDVCFKCVHIDASKVDLGVLYVTMATLHVSRVCFKCFIYFKLYVANISLWMFQN